jgi:hypothetical protein
MKLPAFGTLITKTNFEEIHSYTYPESDINATSYPEVMCDKKIIYPPKLLYMKYPGDGSLTQNRC